VRANTLSLAFGLASESDFESFVHSLLSRTNQNQTRCGGAESSPSTLTAALELCRTGGSRRNGRSSRLGWTEVGRWLNFKEKSVAHLNYSDSMTSRQASVFAGAPARWLRPENGGSRAAAGVGAGGVAKATSSRNAYNHPNLAKAMSVPHQAPVIGPLKHHRHPATDCNSTRRFAFPTVCPSHGYEGLRDWSKRPSWPIQRNGGFK